MPFWWIARAIWRARSELTANPVRNQLQRRASSRPHHAIRAVMVAAFAALLALLAPSNGIANPATTDGTKSDKGQTERSQPIEQSDLPKNVAEMRSALLAAAEAGQIEHLLTPYEWNELPPNISDDRVEDPIAYWKQISRDGQGLEILSILHKLLSLPAAKLRVGPDVENSALYVWPYLSELDLSKLTPKQQFDLRTLVPPGDARKIIATKKWTWWRLAIGADGTWHAFRKYDN